MHKPCLVGIDVSAHTLEVALAGPEPGPRSATFDNTPAGHRRLIRWITKRGRSARVVLEATGVYNLEVALALDRHPRTEVIVVNPGAIKNYAGARLRRPKTDPVDAQLILDFVQRMDFVPWQPPLDKVLQLQAITRRMNHLLSIPGIAQTSALRLIAELAVLPADMKAPQWVAQAGLDPRPKESGNSIHPPRRITKAGNKYLRAALYMPALVAIRFQPQVKAFYEKLITAGKKPLQAIIAVMRKLLHAIWGVWNYNQDFDRQKFYRMSN